MDGSAAAFPTSPTTADNIGERIDAWRDGAGGGAELHVFLGWTWQQYFHYVKSREFPQDASSAA
jgi:hypothetical protein